MIIPIFMPWNNTNTIVCDTWWQYLLVTIGMATAILCLIRLVLSAVSYIKDTDTILKCICGIMLGGSAYFIGIWSAVLSDSTGISLILSIAVFASAFISSAIYGIYKISSCKRKPKKT